MYSSSGFQDMTSTDQNAFPWQHWNLLTFHKKFQIFRINPFTAHFYAKKIIMKTLRSTYPYTVSEITKFVTNITYCAII